MHEYLPTRKHVRLPKYDYSQPGFYYVTICTRHGDHIFGEVVRATLVVARSEAIATIMELNSIGELAQRIWLSLPIMFDYISLDEYIIMPNHIHAIIEIKDPLRSILSGQDSNSSSRSILSGRPQGSPVRLGRIIGAFKSKFMHEYIRMIRSGAFDAFEKTLWHRNYYEHIIRDEDDLNRIRQYIRDNPKNWAIDAENRP